MKKQLSIMVPEFSDIVALLALLVSLAAFWVSTRSAKLDEQRFIGESERVINTVIEDGKALVGEGAADLSIAEVTVFFPNEIEPLKSYNVKAGDAWIPEELKKYFTAYFERNYDQFLEQHLATTTVEEYLDFISTKTIDIEVPMQAAIGVHIRSRSQSRDWRRLGGYRINATYHIVHDLSDIREFKKEKKYTRKVNPRTQSVTIDDVKYIRWIDLEDNQPSISHRLTGELEIPSYNNFGQLEFHFGRALFPSGYAKDD